MSYLLDALSKAERERRLGRVPDLVAEAAHSAPRRPPPRYWLGGLLALTVAANLLVVVWWWSGDDARSPMPMAASAEAGALVTEAQSPPSANPAPAARLADATPGAPVPAVDRPRALAPVPGSAPTGNGRPPAVGAAQKPAVSNAGVSAGAIERSEETPAADPAALAGILQPLPEPPPLSALPERLRADLPPLEVNGLLYSSVPGRSFVLINGRRYHQGERTAAGPAVESITPDGVVMNYQGTRFTLPAPH